MTQFDVPNKPVISKIPNIGYYNIATQHSKLDLQWLMGGFKFIHQVLCGFFVHEMVNGFMSLLASLP